VFGHGALDEHVAARRRRGAEEGAGLDAVGDDRVVDRVQRVDALDVDDVGARAVDRAPILLSTRASSSTSGSRAAPTSCVRPRARAAAIMRFSVPVTVAMSR
jgi:hypothetical protein